MFYWLIELSNAFPPGLGWLRTLLNVFRYITFRTGGAVVTGAAVRVPVRPLDHRSSASAPGQGPADPQRRPAIAHRRQEGHAHHGRADDPVRARGVDPAVGQSAQSLCLDRAGGDARLRLRRLL